MRLASRKNNSRDGQLVFVDEAFTKIEIVGGDIPTLQFALDHWHQLQSTLAERYKKFSENKSKFEKYISSEMLAPLPRAYQWLDGSAFVHHVELARKSRGAVMPESFLG
jgi:fumarylacetoacetate (FAA) hydrolase